MLHRIMPNISLEALSLEHTQELYELTDANREHLREWLPWLDRIQSSSDTKGFIESTLSESSAGGGLNFAILCGSAICGVIGFHEINQQHRLASLGYWLAQEYTGKGIVTAATKRLIKIGFDEFDLNKIEIRCAENNVKSRAVAERLGFTHEAILRQNEWLYTEYVNHAVYSILASEFESYSTK